MKIYNADIAKQFNKLADLLEIDGANPFRIRAYRNASRIIVGLSEELSDLVAQGKDLTELPYIGKDLADKIKQIIQTGELPALKEVEKHTPTVLNQMTELSGLGAKRVKLLYDNLHIKSVNDLKHTIEQNNLSTIPGFGNLMILKVIYIVTLLYCLGEANE